MLTRRPLHWLRAVTIRRPNDDRPEHLPFPESGSPVNLLTWIWLFGRHQADVRNGGPTRSDRNKGWAAIEIWVTGEAVEPMVKVALSRLPVGAPAMLLRRPIASCIPGHSCGLTPSCQQAICHSPNAHRRHARIPSARRHDDRAV
jgi:hypothetical protein